MEPGTLVVASCCGPREKFWGVLLTISPAGITLRGIALPAFEDYLRQESRDAPRLIAATTVFFPIHRIERVEVDESAGGTEGFSDRFRRVTGRDPRGVLLGETPLAT